MLSQQLTDIPVEVGRCKHYGDGLVCDLYEGHKDFHFDYMKDMNWIDREIRPEPLPRFNGTAVVLMLGSAVTVISFFVWLFCKVVR